MYISFPLLSSSLGPLFSSTTFRRANDESQRRGEARRGASHLETLDTGPPLLLECTTYLPTSGYGNRNSVSVKKAEMHIGSSSLPLFPLPPTLPAIVCFPSPAGKPRRARSINLPQQHECSFKGETSGSTSNFFPILFAPSVG